MKHRYFYIPVDHKARPGYNRAVEVYKLTTTYPQFVGGNYHLNSYYWRGYLSEARIIIADKYGHNLPDCFRDFPAKSVTLKELGT